MKIVNYCCKKSIQNRPHRSRETRLISPLNQSRFSRKELTVGPLWLHQL